MLYERDEIRVGDNMKGTPEGRIFSSLWALISIPMWLTRDTLSQLIASAFAVVCHITRVRSKNYCVEPLASSPPPPAYTGLVASHGGTSYLVA